MHKFHHLFDVTIGPLVIGGIILVIAISLIQSHQRGEL